MATEIYLCIQRDVFSPAVIVCFHANFHEFCRCRSVLRRIIVPHAECARDDDDDGAGDGGGHTNTHTLKTRARLDAKELTSCCSAGAHGAHTAATI